MSVLENVRCTVLNASYEPLGTVTARRGLILTIEGKAIITEAHEEFMVRSSKDVWPVPTQIVLKEFINTRSTHHIPAVLTQRNLFIRDGYTCQYCNRHKSDFRGNEKLTRDHVHPQSKGGPDTWKNVVTACSSCNNKKADYVLGDVEIMDMRLKKTPTAPTIFELGARLEKAKKKKI
jgi:5-methylcytosine-specific restriction endonuclease McrA